MVQTGSDLRALRDRDPYPRYAELRREARVSWDDGMQGWLVTAYAECAFVERREDLFRLGVASFPGADDIRGERGILSLRGETHKALHDQVLRHFHPRVVERYRVGFLRPLVDRRIESFAHRGEVEIGTELADRIPSGAMAGLFGLPWQDDDLTERCSQLLNTVMAWSQTFGQAGPELVQPAKRAARQLDDILRPVVRARRQTPEDDLISDLWRVGPSLFADWDEDDVLAQCRVMFEGGNDVVSNMICSLAYLLATRADLRERIEADRSALIPRFVEEGLRLIAPLQLRMRVATEDVELGGVLVRQGERVYPINAAANRDPERFVHPDEVDLERSGFMNHLSFMVGPRHCVGAAFGRAIGIEVVDALIAQIRDPRLNPGAEPPLLVGLVNRSFRPLHLVFNPKTAREPAGELGHGPRRSAL